MGLIADKVLEKQGIKVEGIGAGANAGNNTNAGGPGGDGKTPEELQAEQDEQLRLEKEKTDKAKAEGDNAKTPEELEAERLETEKLEKEKSAAGSKVELTDEELLALLKKRSNKDIKSLDELLNPATAKTPEEIEADKIETKEKALQFALKSKLFDTKQLEAYHIDSARSDREIALEVFAKAQLKENADLTPEEIGERFQDLYFENEQEDDWRRVQKAKEMGYLAKQYRDHKHGAIISAEDEYQNYISATRQATAYKGMVESAVSGFDKKLTFNIEGKDYFANVSDKTMLSIQENLLNSETFTKLGQGNVSEDQMKQILNQSVISKELPKLMAEVAKSYASDMMDAARLGRRGIPPTREGGEEDANAPAEYPGKAKALLAKFNADKGK